ncbi:Na+/H+ antiporter NhaA [Lonsdalea quercina]|uniref:Na+/H+ antiporter NhaA n=1 Tax=Lonsdalea quercina TaxID=71657 RepID=UPI00397622BB
MMRLLRRFARLDAAAGITLIAATLLALLMANIPLTAMGYDKVLTTPLDVTVGEMNIHASLLHAINDGLMTLFFLMVGLEVKRELMVGALASRRQALLPVAAALGGMVVPALIYLAINATETHTRVGWAIPTATDIAFAVGILVLLGKRVPLGLKVFLLALAIIDDLGAILVIALFYTQQLHGVALLGAALSATILAYMNWRQVTNTPAYLLVGVVLWLCVLLSGVHATLAGVVVGFLIPLRAPAGQSSPATALEHRLSGWVAFLIIPLFAFANAGIALQGVDAGQMLSPLTVGIAAGLLIGKPLGIMLFSGGVIALRLATLPAGVNFRQLSAVSVLCGIGFTMSIFITLLSFGGEADAATVLYAKLAILMSSLAAGAFGFIALRIALPAVPVHTPVPREE